MRGRRLEIVLWVVAAGLLLAAGLGTRRSALGGAGDFVEVSLAVGEGPVFPNPEELERDAGAIAARDPFRLERHPSPVAYRAELEGVAPPPAPKPAKPLLVVAGIVGGPPWHALVEGIPERSGGVLVSEGDVIGGLKVRVVRRDSVVIQGADTTWRLGIKRSWQ